MTERRGSDVQPQLVHVVFLGSNEVEACGFVCLCWDGMVVANRYDFCILRTSVCCRGNSSVVERWIPVPAVGGSIPSSLNLYCPMYPYVRS